MAHSIIDNVTAGEMTVFDPVSATVADVESELVVDEYDANNDGDVSIIE